MWFNLSLFRQTRKKKFLFFFGFCGTCATLMVNEHYFKDFGLNPDDFKDLKWEDEPVEVFLNLED